MPVEAGAEEREDCYWEIRAMCIHSQGHIWSYKFRQLCEIYSSHETVFANSGVHERGSGTQVRHVDIITQGSEHANKHTSRNVRAHQHQGVGIMRQTPLLSVASARQTAGTSTLVTPESDEHLQTQMTAKVFCCNIDFA